jgi:predicted secreted protein
MNVKLGEIFEIVRVENPSTGYTYFNEELSDGLKLIKSEFIYDENDLKKQLFGSPGYHIWRIMGTKYGRQTIFLYYGQEWDDTTWERTKINVYVV